MLVTAEEFEDLFENSDQEEQLILNENNSNIATSDLSDLTSSDSELSDTDNGTSE